MISPNLKRSLPSTQDLPCSDDTSVDNEDQKPNDSEQSALQLD
ncbi:MAG: hypothetical protein WA902_00920 [Thermosynechococcaceae cyanobacterium]